jgi:uncharacterized repeat protein (TIGR02543 family)
MLKNKRFICVALVIALIAAMAPWSALMASASFTGTFQFDSNGKFTVMQLTDIQDDQNVDARIISAITRAIARYSPDLIVFTGDNIKGSISVANFKKSVDSFLAPLISTNTKFAVTFGNHDAESSILGNPGSKTDQYAYYKSKGGSLFVEHDIAALDGVGSGVIPIYANGQTSGTPAYQVYLMDSNDAPSSGSYDAAYTSQVDYYIQTSQTYPAVPSLWFQHVIVPDVYTKAMTISTSGKVGGAAPFSSNNWTLNPSFINWSRSSSTVLADIYREGPCSADQSVYESAAHRSSAAYGSKTLYQAWDTYGNLKGAYFGHDHLNEFTVTTSDGIDLGYGDSTGLLFGYKDDDPGVSVYELNINGSYTTEFSAESDLDKVMVSFDANGGNGTMKSQLIAQNTTAPLNLNTGITKTGYTFGGWNTKADGTGTPYANGANITVTSADIKLYAKWEQNTLITFNANGGAGGFGPVSMQAGTSLTAPVVARTGYTFLGWSPAVPATVPVMDTTYVAQWSINSYTVAFDANGGEGGSVTSLQYGDPVMIPSVARTGYTFTGWLPEVPATVPAENSTFTAQWVINNYMISFDANGGEGSSTASMAYGTPLQSPAVTKTGYTFTGWLPEVPASVPAEDAIYTAQWSINSYNVVFDANGGTGGTAGLFEYGSAIEAPVVARFGYTFDGWDPALPLTVPANDVTYTAQWTATQYSYTFDPGGGTGGKSGMFYLWDDLASFAPTVTKTGNTFAGWSPVIPAVTPMNDVYFTALWNPNSYTITFNANGGTGGTSALMVYGTALVAPPVKKTGFTLTGWTPSLPQTVPAANRTYTAIWTVSKYLITFDANGGTGGTSKLLAYGTVIVPPTVTRTNYIFIGWTPSVAATVGESDLTYTAIWQSIPPSVLPRADSTTVIDSDRGLIFGLKTGLTRAQFESSFAYLGGNGSFAYSTTGLLGTGTKIDLIDNATGLVIQSYTIVIFGDVNGDGNIDDGDSGQVVDYENYLYNWDNNPERKMAGDVNGDGAVDSLDAGILTDVLNYMMHINQMTGMYY